MKKTKTKPKDYKAFRVRLYPDSQQEKELFENCGSCRFVWNHFLALNKIKYEKEKKFIFRFDMQKMLPKLKKTYPFLSSVDAWSLQQVCKDLDQALKNCFKYKKGFPKFKARYKNQNSFRTDGYRSVVNVKLKAGKHRGLKYRGLSNEFDFDSRIKRITVSRDSSHRWYASILVEWEYEKLDSFPHESCGVDLGIVNPLMVTNGKKSKSLGKKFSKRLRRREKLRERQQKILARKKRGSKNYAKQKIKVATNFLKENQLRKDWIEKMSDLLSKTFSVICIEDLQIKKMTEGYIHKINGGMRRLGLGYLISRLETKCKQRGSTLIKVDPKYTSQTCSCCGVIDKKSRISQSKFVCVECGFKIHADKNASLNILRKGTQGTRGTQASATTARRAA